MYQSPPKTYHPFLHVAELGTANNGLTKSGWVVYIYFAKTNILAVHGLSKVFAFVAIRVSASLL